MGDPEDYFLPRPSKEKGQRKKVVVTTLPSGCVVYRPSVWVEDLAASSPRKPAKR